MDKDTLEEIGMAESDVYETVSEADDTGENSDKKEE